MSNTWCRPAVTAFALTCGCSNAPRCLRHDDATTILKKVLTADGIVLASPVYPNQIKSIEFQKQYFRKLITLRKGDWPYEYQFWKNQDWL